MWVPLIVTLVAMDWEPVATAAAASLLGGAGIGGFLAWAQSKRTTSGTVATSDAGTLFQAMRQFQESQDRVIERQDATIQRQEAKIADLNQRLAVAEHELSEHRGCKERIAVLERRLSER